MFRMLWNRNTQVPAVLDLQGHYSLVANQTAGEWFMKSTFLLAVVAITSFITVSCDNLSGIIGGQDASKDVDVPAKPIMPNLELKFVDPVLVNGEVGEDYSKEIRGSGGIAGAAYTFEVVSSDLPPGLTLANTSQLTAILSGIPTREGSYVFVLGIRNVASNVLEVEQVFTIKIAANTATFDLTIRLPYLAATQGLPFHGIRLFADGGVEPYMNWKLIGAPSWISIDASTGELSGNTSLADKATDYVFLIRVSDSNSPSLLGQVSALFTLYPDASRGGLYFITDALLNDAYVGIEYDLTFGIAGGSGPLWVDLAGGELPTGLLYDWGLTISGTPQPGSEGFYSITLKVQDFSTSSWDMRTFYLTVHPAPPNVLSITYPAYTTPPLLPELPDASENVAYDVQLQAQGGKAPYIWGLIPAAIGGSEVPGWLAVSDDGKLSGMPTGAQSSRWSFDIVVVDADSHTALMRDVTLYYFASGGTIPPPLPQGDFNFIFMCLPLMSQGLFPSPQYSPLQYTEYDHWTTRKTLEVFLDEEEPWGVVANPVQTGIEFDSIVIEGSLPAGLALTYNPGGQGVSLTGGVHGVPSVAGATDFTIVLTEKSGIQHHFDATILVSAPGTGSNIPDIRILGTYLKEVTAVDFDPSGRYMFVCQFGWYFGDSCVVRLDRQTGRSEPWLNSLYSQTDGVNFCDLCISKDGAMYIATHGGGVLKVAHPLDHPIGRADVQQIRRIGWPTECKTSADGSRLYVSDFGLSTDSNIYEFDTQSGELKQILADIQWSGGEMPQEGLAIWGNDLYYSNGASTGRSCGIFRIADRDFGNSETISLNFGYPGPMDFDSKGNLYVTDCYNSSILKFAVDPSAGRVSPLSSSSIVSYGGSLYANFLRDLKVDHDDIVWLAINDGLLKITAP